MFNYIWFNWHWIVAALKELMRMKLKPFDEFVLEIGS